MVVASPFFIAYAKGLGCTGPAWFRKLHELRKGPEEYRLVPATADDPATAEMEERCRQSMSAVRALWNDRTGIASLLASPSLKKNIYTPKCVAKHDEEHG